MSNEGKQLMTNITDTVCYSDHCWAWNWPEYAEEYLFILFNDIEKHYANIFVPTQNIKANQKQTKAPLIFVAQRLHSCKGQRLLMITSARNQQWGRATSERMKAVSRPTNLILRLLWKTCLFTWQKSITNSLYLCYPKTRWQNEWQTLLVLCMTSVDVLYDRNNGLQAPLGGSAVGQKTSWVKISIASDRAKYGAKQQPGATCL